ncbi:Tyrosine recombinase XerD [Algoriella xinjiangensis]|uniref:site-specific integrase n=1 Tax=Algoriella xinjiangensis TaxID=684065 RepID=UPI000F637921|nr:site-specific integrase [Algoriella xinjiangensis]VDH16673.1 Tyrosine recombinase XerD [Algoriella xinjiangensis]
MSQIQISLVYNRKNKLNKNGEALIQICCYQNGKRTYFSTEIYIKPNEWNEKKMLINDYRNDYEELNDEIDRQITELKDSIKIKKQKGESVSLSNLKEIKEVGIYISFYKFMQDEIEKGLLKESTKKSQRRTLLVLREFRKELEFKDLNVSFLMDFERYLNLQSLGTNTIYKYFKNIRTYVNLAIVKDLMQINDYPFKKFKLRQVDGNRDFLSPDELKRLEKLKYSDENDLNKVRDIFLFSCYTGIRFSDIVRLKDDNFSKVGDVYWLTFDMMKSERKNDSSTKKILRLPISKLFDGKPVKIFEKYRGEKKFLFDDFINSEINKHLKTIENKLRSGKKLSFHVARHTCATNLIYHGLPISTVQKILGHDKIETTQVYAKVLDVTLLNDLDKIDFK